MVEPSEYVDGVSIRWGRVASTLIGATIFAYFEGIVATFLSLVDIPLGLLAGFGDFLGEFLTLYYGVIPAMIRGGWSGAVGLITSAGIAGYFVAVGYVLLLAYLASVVIRRAT